MYSTTTRNKMLVPALLMSGLGWLGSAGAADVTLCAGQYTKIVDGGIAVEMWGFAAGGATAGTCDGSPSSPGPEIVVPAGDTLLTVTLHNTLLEPVSLVIPGQLMPAGAPVFAAGGRVRSFTTETAPGGSAVYSWGSVKAGSYAYQSGTHPAVQVQMGLYGAMIQDAALGEAYPGISYDTQTTLVYSEIDPVMHAAIIAGTVGSIDGLAASTVDYDPRYFLVNGEVYNGSNNSFAISGPGQRSLIRFINIGLEMHAPTVNGARMQVVAEDGNVYPDYRDQYSVRLAAGKTRDAIISVPADAANGTVYAVYDRMLNVSNDGAIGAGGMMSFLTVGATGGTLPTAVDDVYADATEDTLYSRDALGGVLINDSSVNPPITASLVSGVAHGSLTLNADGSFDYAPEADYFGFDSFTYAATDSVGSQLATAMITVANVNDAPVANDDSYAAAVGELLAVNVLSNDNDVDGDALTATSGSSTDPALSIAADGSINYTPGAAGTFTVAYTAVDPSLLSSAATATITVTGTVSEPPVAVDDAADVPRNGTVNIAVLANDTDADGPALLAPPAYTVAITTIPDDRRGVATANGDGTITFTSINVDQPGKQPRRGTATFNYTVTQVADGATSEATVRVNVTK